MTCADRHAGGFARLKHPAAERGVLIIIEKYCALWHTNFPLVNTARQSRGRFLNLQTNWPKKWIFLTKCKGARLASLGKSQSRGVKLALECFLTGKIFGQIACHLHLPLWMMSSAK